MPFLRSIIILAGVLLVPATIGARTVATMAAPSALVAFTPEEFAGAALGRLEPEVFRLALGAASCAVRTGRVSTPQTLTVIDYSKPSTEPRLWVIDLSNRKLIYEELVAHGQGTGGNTATLFSNEPETHRSSLGLFVTDTTYVGKNGYSLRLDGLDPGLNDRARERAIVMHGAPYVSPAYVRANGRLGRSWGCPAVRSDVARALIDTVKGGSLVFAYHRDAGLTKKSQFLNGCGA